jgi:hypothetical protein
MQHEGRVSARHVTGMHAAVLLACQLRSNRIAWSSNRVTQQVSPVPVALVTGFQHSICRRRTAYLSPNSAPALPRFSSWPFLNTDRWNLQCRNTTPNQGVVTVCCL